MRRFVDRSGCRALAAGCLAASLASALIGCGSRPVAVALPTRPPQTLVTTEGPPRPTTRQLVVAAYQGYWRATTEALDSDSATRARQILAGYVPLRAVPALVRGLRALWRRNEIGYGGPVFHIMAVTITGPRTAAVHDCIDLSHAGFENRLTGQVSGGLGRSHDFLITTLALEQGRWLVTGAVPVVQTCSY